MKRTLLAVVIIIIFIGGFCWGVQQKRSNDVGLFLVSTVTNSSSSVGMTDTIVIGLESELQYFWAQNLGSGRINCGFNATTTLNGTAVATSTGVVINPIGSSTATIYETSDQNLLSKIMHCRADATSTLSILKYKNL